ncbi:non-homologous end-joining DNA ligase [Desulfolucanica intricata]|uniref:non-homologous end-joining DNA ligase n=1 Tax=Desulfolucanica intricata TaxID=1285191 RepID=UPI00082CF5B1|nr:non-homologous end-joining DNA ligase [Desulfolucanica intricata]
MSIITTVNVADKEVKLTNLQKNFWPGDITKAHLVKYYYEMAPVLLPHLYNRPLVMKRYPDGIDGEAFYQKECPDYAPAWIKTVPVEHSEKVVNYIVCDNPAALVWLANQGCIEIHPWLSRIENVECPNIAVMDLDPAPGATFNDVLEIALLVKKALEEFNLRSYPKTSGATGLHIFIPIKPIYAYKTVTKVMQYIAELIVKTHPTKATVERKVAKRTGKVYLDYLQNGRGKTMAFQYSLRPLPGAPVSTPVYWEEIEAKKVEPGSFNIHNIFTRIKKVGDIYRGALSEDQILDTILNLININNKNH